MSRVVRTEMRVMCPDCGHAEKDHQLPSGGTHFPRCCGNYCRCPLTKEAVAERGLAVESPVFAGYNAETGHWS